MQQAICNTCIVLTGNGFVKGTPSQPAKKNPPRHLPQGNTNLYSRLCQSGNTIRYKRKIDAASPGTPVVAIGSFREVCSA